MGNGGKGAGEEVNFHRNPLFFFIPLLLNSWSLSHPSKFSLDGSTLPCRLGLIPQFINRASKQPRDKSSGLYSSLENVPILSIPFGPKHERRGKGVSREAGAREVETQASSTSSGWSKRKFAASSSFLSHAKYAWMTLSRSKPRRHSYCRIPE